MLRQPPSATLSLLTASKLQSTISISIVEIAGHCRHASSAALSFLVILLELLGGIGKKPDQVVALD
jgi:hypothetical protein